MDDLDGCRIWMDLSGGQDDGRVRMGWRPIFWTNFCAGKTSNSANRLNTVLSVSRLFFLFFCALRTAYPHKVCL